MFSFYDASQASTGAELSFHASLSTLRARRYWVCKNNEYKALAMTAAYSVMYLCTSLNIPCHFPCDIVPFLVHRQRTSSPRIELCPAPKLPSFPTASSIHPNLHHSTPRFNLAATNAFHIRAPDKVNSACARAAFSIFLCPSHPYLWHQ